MDIKALVQNIPALAKAGWTRHQKMPRSLLVWSGRGGSFNYRLFHRLNEPLLMLRAVALALRARLRELRLLRDIFCSRSHPSFKRRGVAPTDDWAAPPNMRLITCV